MISTSTFKRGAKNGINTIYELGKVILPVYMIVTILKYTVILDYIANIFAPIMKVFGLPGEAALALVIGNLLNLYAALGVIASINLTAKQITIVSVMLSFSHALPIETAVSKRVGVSVTLVLVCRIGLAIICGIILNLLM